MTNKKKQSNVVILNLIKDSLGNYVDTVNYQVSCRILGSEESRT